MIVQAIRDHLAATRLAQEARLRQAATDKPKTRRRLWLSPRLAVERRDDLKVVARAGRVLEELTRTVAWTELQAIKHYLQVLATAKSLNSEAEDRARFQAAVEWQAIESVFKEVTRRIQRGREAHDLLTRLPDT